MARLTSTASVTDDWRQYHEQGLTVFPLKRGGKNPGTDFGIKWQLDWVQKGKPTYPDLATTYESGTYGLWLATGQCSKRVVLDLDRPEAETYWREKLGDAVFNQALKVTTGREGGKHLHFRIREDDNRVWDGHSDEHIGYDFRGDGGGVVMPPSVHKSGRRYEWIDGELQDAPEILRKENQPKQVQARETGRSGGSSTTLASELMLPPDDPGRGNNWLARVAGFLAKSERRYYDRYVALCTNINWASADPIEEGAFMKTIESIWGAENNKTEHQDQTNGWLIGDGSRLYTLMEIGSGDSKKTIPGEWADFDIRVRSITRDSDGTLVYTVDLFTDDHTYESVQLDPSIFSTDSKLSAWLAVRGATILPVPYDKFSGHPHRARLAKYLKNQQAASSNAVRFLGWNGSLSQFIVHEGVIDEHQIRPHDGSVPDPVLTSWAPYRYGVVSEAEAIEVLKEVLTYQDEAVTSVFASWWAMALLKGRYQTSQFPFMSIEAPSESGKSTGFFAMMVAMSGNTNGHGRYTAPAFRDALAGHRNGITWLDDVTEITDLQDTIRQLTAEGHTSKKGTDRRETESVQLLCPLVVSGEGLGSVMSEKAMRDRAIALEVSSPKGRKSLKNPDRPQWDDIVEMLSRYSTDGKPEGMTALAGTLVALVHKHAGMLREIKNLRTTNGRHGDKMAIIRMGARIIAEITGDPLHVERVDSWCTVQADEGSVNYAIGEIVPWFLRSNLIPVSAMGHQAAYYDSSTDTVWVSPAKLADAWKMRNGLTAREKQLGTEDAIRSELKANSVDTKGKPKWTDRTSNGKKARYCALEGALATLVMDKVGATMDDPDE
jgi:hypothetical protein